MDEAFLKRPGVLPLSIPSPWKGENAWEWFWVLEAAALAVALLVSSVIKDWAPWQRIAGLAGGALFFAIAWTQAMWILRPSMRRDARIEVDPGGLLIKGQNVFEEPARIERDRVRLVTFDPSADDVKHRFPVLNPTGANPKEQVFNSFLFHKGSRDPVPTSPAHHSDEAPNLAIMLKTPVRLPGRRNIRTFFTRPQYFVNQSIRVITARVADLALARSTFEELELVRSPSMDDLVASEPTPEEKRQLKRLERLQWVALISMIVAFFGGPIIYLATGG